MMYRINRTTGTFKAIKTLFDVKLDSFEQLSNRIGNPCNVKLLFFSINFLAFSDGDLLPSNFSREREREHFTVVSFGLRKLRYISVVLVLLWISVELWNHTAVGNEQWCLRLSITDTHSPYNHLKKTPETCFTYETNTHPHVPIEIVSVNKSSRSHFWNFSNIALSGLTVKKVGGENSFICETNIPLHIPRNNVV